MKKRHDNTFGSDLFGPDESKDLDQYLFNRELRWEKDKEKQQEEKETKKKREPWQDENGKLLCDTKLKIVSKHWDEDTWKRYLKTIEYYQREQLVDDYDAVLHKHGEQQAMENYLSDPDSEKNRNKAALENKVKKLVFELPFLEMAVIRALFYDNHSTRKTAKKLGISDIQVRRLRDSAIQRLREQLDKKNDENGDGE